MKIALVGKMLCGKTTALNHFVYLSKFYNRTQTSIKFADPLYSAQHCFSPLKHREFLQELSDLAKKHFGTNILNEKFTERLSKIDSLDIFCDDIRVFSEFEMARNLDFILIGVQASEKIRKIRNPKLFVGTEHSTEIEIDNLLPKCDYLVDNERTLTTFLNKLTKIYEENFIKTGVDIFLKRVYN